MEHQRWNSKGTEIVYTANSRALAVCEVSVHLPLGLLPKNYLMVEIEIPDSIAIQTIPPNTLPSGWNKTPPLASSRFFGDEFVIQSKYAILQVPSAVVQGDYNYLINPKHSDFGKIKINKKDAFPFDMRLFFKA